MKCSCCTKEFDFRVARVTDESFSHKSMNHYVCSKCFSDIEYQNNKGLMGWYLMKWLYMPISKIFYKTFNYPLDKEESI
jgi:hypothetical protein